MKKYFMIFAAALISLAACQEEMAPENKVNEDGIFDYPVQLTFTAGNETATKTVINGTNIMWESTDAIKVLWSATGCNKAIAEPYAENTCAKFSTKVEEADAYFAVHPYAASSTYSEGNIIVTVPAQQGGAFADANIAVAKATEEYAFHFKHLVGIVEFTTDVPGKVTICGAEGDVLTGTVTVTGFDDDGLPVYEVADGSNTIEIDVTEAGTYYAAFLPSANLKCLSIKVGEGDAAGYALSANQLQMARGKVWELGNVSSRLGLNYFVSATADGNGDGKTWETAFTYQQMADFVAANRPDVSGVSGTNTDVAASGFSPTTMSADEYKTLHNTEHAAELNGVTFHLAAGTYSSSAYVRISFPERGEAVKMTFKGGYPASAKGTDLSGRDPENNVTTISGGNSRRLFFIRYYCDVTFDGVKLADGWVNTGGGALLFNESATSSVVFNNCDFDNNKSTDASSGGVVCAKNGVGTLAFTDCNFTNNSSAVYGGVVYAGASDSQFTFTRCKFNGNTSVNNGGVLWLNPIGSAVFKNCNFTSNTVSENNVGGVIYSNGASKILFEETYFTDNKAGRSGGALYHSGTGTISLTKCVLSDNTAGTEVGGAIYGSGAATWLLTGTELTGNTSKNDGGAIRFSNGTWTLDGCTLKSNVSSAGLGGAIYANTGSMTVKNNCLFETNQATANSAGAIYVTTNATVSIADSKFINNKALKDGAYGGAVYVANTVSAAVKINNCLFKDNKAEYGSAVNAHAKYENSTHTAAILYLNNCIFTGSATYDYTSETNNGVVYTKGNLYMNNCMFYGNEFSKNNNSIVANAASGGSDSQAVIMNTTVVEDADNMGAIVAYYDNVKPQLYNNVFLSKQTAINGGYGTSLKAAITSSGYNYYAGSTLLNSSTFTPTESDTNVTYDNVIADFALTETTDGRNYYTWTAPEDISMTTVADMTNFLNGVTGGADFATWLGTVNGLSHDIAGNPRPATGAVYPGCYQKQ